MRRFVCEVCGDELPFEAVVCGTCTTAAGYLPADATVHALRVVDDVAYARWAAPDPAPSLWRCLNFAWGCNWMLAAESGAVWCASCRLTRGRPDDASIDAVLAWSSTEQAKRRLVDQLHVLGLPIGSSPRSPDAVVFDLVYLPENSRGVTGHRTGVVTFDLREVDDRFREQARVSFGEPDRTVLGHLRHEIGHHFWDLLVARSGAIDECRALFGDERIDYEAALDEHYRRLGKPIPDTHVSGYATAHPSEDWAETFAHHLAIVDGLETAAAWSLIPPQTPSEPFASLLDRWRATAAGVNQVATSLGHRAPYPFTITEEVGAKLAFVHERVAAHQANRATEPADRR